MNQQINMNILKQADEITLQRIAEEFPIDFGKEDIFERAYHAYLEKSAEPKSPIRRHAVHIAAAAACCVLVLSAAYAVGIAPRQIPSIPEESTTETHAAAKPTQENTETTVHTEHTEQTEQTENTEHTNPAETTAAQTTAASETGTQTQTGVAVVIPPTAETTVLLPETTQPTAATDPTEPTAETQTDITMEPMEPMERPNSTTQPMTEATDPTWMTEEATDIPAVSTENPVIPTEEATFPEEDMQESARPPHTESPEEPTKPTETTTLPTLAGYDVTLENGQLQVVYQNEVPSSPLLLHPYNMESGQFTIKSTAILESAEERRKYRILHQESGETFTVYQSRREQFRAACQSDAELIEYDVNGSPAFLAIYTAYKEKYCALYWDDGNYTFTVTSTDENRELLLRLAESFRSPIK